MTKTIIHFHPHGTMASIFVAPLVDFERSLGYQSTLVTSIHATKYQEKNISYDLRLSHILHWPRALMGLWHLISRSKPDVVISHNSKSSLLPLLVAYLLRVPSRVYFNHGVPFLGYNSFFKLLLIGIEKLNFFFANHVVTVCEDMKVALQSVNQGASISLIAHGSACGLDLSLYDPHQYEKSLFRDKYGIAQNDVVTIFVGRPEKRKGFDLALQLWGKNFQGSHHQLVLCGPTRKDVEAIMGTVPNNVICLGFVSNVPEILAASDCLILPSYHEGLPYSILEAMASACVVVANDIPGVRCLIQDGVNGFLIPNQSVEGYAQVITSLATLPEGQLRSIKLKAIATAQLYSREKFMSAYRQYLQELL